MPARLLPPALRSTPVGVAGTQEMDMAEVRGPGVTPEGEVRGFRPGARVETTWALSP